jgi:hypothetical protein
MPAAGLAARLGVIDRTARSYIKGLMVAARRRAPLADHRALTAVVAVMVAVQPRPEGFSVVREAL